MYNFTIIIVWKIELIFPLIHHIRPAGGGEILGDLLNRNQWLILPARHRSDKTGTPVTHLMAQRYMTVLLKIEQYKPKRKAFRENVIK